MVKLIQTFFMFIMAIPLGLWGGGGGIKNMGINQWWAFTAPASLKVLDVAAGNTYTGASQYLLVCSKNVDWDCKTIGASSANTYSSSNQFQ